MKTITICLLFSLLSFGEVLNYKETAKRDDGSLAYTSKNILTLENNKPSRLQSNFFDPQGKEFAKSDALFSQYDYLPKFDFVDDRFILLEGLKVNGKDLTLYYKQNSEEKMGEKKFTFEDNMVVIQGFLPYIMKYAEDIGKGNVKKVQLLLPSQLSSFNFNVEGNKISDNVVKVVIKVSNIFLRLVVDRVEMEYDLAKKRLNNYYGITVIRKPNGGNEKYRIEYTYD